MVAPAWGAAGAPPRLVTDTFSGTGSADQADQALTGFGQPCGPGWRFQCFARLVPALPMNRPNSTRLRGPEPVADGADIPNMHSK